MSAKLQKCEQQDLALFPLKAKKGDIQASYSHVLSVRTHAAKNKGEYVKAILKDHAAIKGFGMIVLILWIIVAGSLNIHCPCFFIPVVIFACGLLCPAVARHIWPRLLTINRVHRDNEK